MSTEQLAMH